MNYQHPLEPPPAYNRTDRTGWAILFYLLVVMYFILLISIPLRIAHDRLSLASFFDYVLLALQILCPLPFIIILHGYANYKRYLNISFWKLLLPMLFAFDFYSYYPYFNIETIELVLSDTKANSKFIIQMAMKIPLDILEYYCAYKYIFSSEEIWGDESQSSTLKVKIMDSVIQALAMALVTGGLAVGVYLLFYFITDGSEVSVGERKDAKTFYYRGNEFAKKGQYESAILNYDKAIVIDPNYDEAYNSRGLLYVHKGMYDSAISDINEALKLSSDNAKAFNNRGLAYFYKGQYDKAISDISIAIKINPKLAFAYHDRGNAYSKKFGDKKMGCPDWKIACELGDCESYTNAKQEGFCDKGSFR